MDKDKSQYLILKNNVEKAINGSNDQVLANVVKAIAMPIIDERRDMLIKGMEVIAKGEEELPKIKADVKEYTTDESGNPVESATPARYSQAQFEKRKKLKEKIDAFYKAIESAIPGSKSVPDYEPLKKLLEKEKG